MILFKKSQARQRKQIITLEAKMQQVQEQMDQMNIEHATSCQRRRRDVEKRATDAQRPLAQAHTEVEHFRSQMVLNTREISNFYKFKVVDIWYNKISYIQKFI